MTEESNKDPYGLIPEGEAEGAERRAASGASPHEPNDDDDAERGRPLTSGHVVEPAASAKGEDPWEPILVEGEDATECPNCGAPMPGDEEVVCIRCGFDLTRMAPVRIEKGEVIVDESGEVVAEGEKEEPEIPKPPLTLPGKGGMPLPAIISGACMLIVIVAYLLGAPGLFNTYEGNYRSADHEQYEAREAKFRESAPIWSDRLLGATEHTALVLLVSASTFGGLAFLGFVEKRKVGEANLALLRCLMIVSACAMFRLIGLPEGYFLTILEFLLQAALMGGVFILLATLLFELDMRQSAMLCGVALGILLVLHFVFWVVESSLGL